MDELTKGYTFNFKITSDEMKGILINHLLATGAITPNEEKLYSSFHQKAGNGIMVEFAVSPEKHV